MSRPTCRPPRPVPEAVLDRLADHLLTARIDEPRAGATLVRVGSGPADDDVDVGLLPLPDDLHPTDLLLGEVVPSRWWAAGVVASGRAWSPGSTDDVRPVDLVVIVARDGRCVHRVHGADPATSPGIDPPDGRLVDLLLRSLGCPTPPPTEAPNRVWSAMWLDRIAVAVLADEREIRSFADAVALHPLAVAVPSSGTATGPVVPQGPAAFDKPESWRLVHRLASRRGVATSVDEALVRAAVAEHLSADEAAWMDEGCLARWLVSEVPPASELLALTDSFLPTSVAADLRRAVEAPLGGPPERPSG